MSQQDKIFLRNFSLLIAGLMAFTVVIIFFGFSLNNEANYPADPTKVAAAEDRLRPSGQVFSGAEGRAAMEAARQAAAAAAAQSVAFGGSLDGNMIYQQVCAACHTSGVAGSPTLNQAAWTNRIAQGVETLVSHAIEGYQGAAGLMPARGGRMDLSDEQVQVTVQWMLDNLQ